MVSASLVPSADLGCLSALLSPISSEEFLGCHWQKHFLHVPGPVGKFKHLFSWPLLNKLLEEYPFDSPRMRLSKAGKPISPDKYLVSRTDRNGTLRSIRSVSLTSELKQGATLILNYADDVSPSLRDLCVGLERVFRKHVVANLYAGFRTDNCFPLHWDEQDTLILQIAGRKKWQIYEPTLSYPLEGRGPVPPMPTAAPTWDSIIEEGSLFHIPRGWWHVAYPLDEPSLHVTVTVNTLTGLDLLHWIVEEMGNSLTARANIPIWEERERQGEYVDVLKRDLISAWKPELLARFIGEMESSIVSRPHMQLPDSASSEGLMVDENTYLRLAAGRAVILPGEDDGVLKFRCVRKVWRCSESLLPVLNLLNDGGRHVMREFCALASNESPESMTYNIIKELVQNGVVLAERNEESVPAS